MALGILPLFLGLLGMFFHLSLPVLYRLHLFDIPEPRSSAGLQGFPVGIAIIIAFTAKITPTSGVVACKKAIVVPVDDP